MEDWRNGGFGVYVHWPFCQSKCPYCDFNSHVAQRIDQSRWAAAYLAEIDRVSVMTEGRVVNSVFFGGGTPSLMDPAVVLTVIDRIKDRWAVANDLEITLEANPSSVEADRFKAYADAGVNRVSLGIQALNDGDLGRLGRLHSADEARRSIAVAQSTFARVSIDLIYARQDQSIQAWDAELQEAIGLGTDHLSLYQLTIEDGTAFGRLHKKKRLLGLPMDDQAADMFEVTRERCRAAGLAAYEVSNHAKVGEESRHNLIYWRMGDYIGIGPGAHGRLTFLGKRFASVAERLPDAWLNCVEGGVPAEARPQILSREEQATEYLLMSLRLAEGSSLSRYSGIAGEPLRPDGQEEMISLGFLSRDNDRIKTTEKGVLVLDGVLRSLLADRQSAS